MSTGTHRILSVERRVSPALLASALVLTATLGCSTKNYVRSQTAPIIQQTIARSSTPTSAHRRASPGRKARRIRPISMHRRPAARRTPLTGRRRMLTTALTR